MGEGDFSSLFAVGWGQNRLDRQGASRAFLDEKVEEVKSSVAVVQCRVKRCLNSGLVVAVKMDFST